MAANLQAHGIKLAFGETVQEITGNGKVEKLITDKASYKVDMVILAVGFKPTLVYQMEVSNCIKMVHSSLTRSRKQVFLEFML